jgi:hypothetical protein
MLSIPNTQETLSKGFSCIKYMFTGIKWKININHGRIIKLYGFALKMAANADFIGICS